MALVRSRPVLHHPFAPWLAPADQLARTLVGREEALRNIIKKIEAMGKGGGAKHVLIIGPRGMGKTHLVCFLKYYVSQQIAARGGLPSAPENWTPVLFVEEEYAAHDTLANLLLSLCSKLHEADPGEEVWRLPEKLRDRSDQAVTDCCLERIQEFSTKRGKKLLILVDNAQKILQQFPPEDHRRLRAFLMDQTAVLLVGTAPWLFKEVIDYRAPFFEFFETIYLLDLTPEEMLRLLEARFQEDGLEAEFRKREENLRRKIPAIRKLTGGNPRLILFLYQIITRSAVLEVESALRELIEELSDYFRSRYDTLADQPRKVLDTLAQMEGPSTPTEISRAARLSIQKVNAQLKRLKGWGYLEPVKHERRRATHYDVTERLFRIWRQTATVAGRQRFKFLTEFLKIYYTPEEILGIARSYRSELQLGEKLLAEESYRHAVEDLYYFQEATTGALSREIFRLRMEALLHIKDYARAEQEAEHFLVGSVKAEDQTSMAVAHKSQAEVHTAAGRYEEALNDVEQLLRMDHDQDALTSAESLLEKAPRSAEAWSLRGRAAGNVGDYAKALESFEKATALQPEDGDYWRLQAGALWNLERYAEALTCAERAVALRPDDAWAWELRGVAAGSLGDHAKALESFEKATALQPEQAEHWSLQALALRNLERYAEALTCAERAVALRPDDAWAWELRGRAAGSLGDHAKVLESFERAKELMPDDVSHVIGEACTLNDLGRTEEALKVLAEVLARNPSNADVFLTYGDLLLLSGRFDEAKEALQSGVALSPDDWGLAVDREIARACLGEHGPNMDGLAAAILSVEIPAKAQSSVVQFLLDMAAKCTTRGDLDRARGLLDAALSLPWQQEEWFGKTLGLFLGKLLDAPPHAFEMAIDKVKGKVVEPDILALLNPYLQAAAYARTGNASILDRLFPEVRELVLEISQRLQRRTPSTADHRGDAPSTTQ